MKQALLLAAAIVCATSTSFAQSTERNPAIPSVDVDALFTYGLGNGHSLGAATHAMLSWNSWRTTRVHGSIELGFSAGYINEPIALQPWNANTSTTGTTHRLPFALTLGHTFRFGAEQRWSFGMHAYAGIVHWISAYRVNFPSRAIEGDGFATATVKDLGFFLRFTYRPHPIVGFSLQLGAPIFGISPDTVVGLFTLGGGVTFRLH